MRKDQIGNEFRPEKQVRAILTEGDLGRLSSKPRTVEHLSNTKRRSNTVTALYCALVKAQSAVEPLKKRNKNEHFGYSFTDSDEFLDAGRQALNAAGLAVFPVSAKEIAPKYGESDLASGVTHRATWCRYSYKIVHTSGEWEIIGPRDYPVTPEKGALRAAWAASDSLAIKYLYRDLLGIPQVDLSAKEKADEEAAATTAEREREAAERAKRKKAVDEANAKKAKPTAAKNPAVPAASPASVPSVEPPAPSLFQLTPNTSPAASPPPTPAELKADAEKIADQMVALVNKSATTLSDHGHEGPAFRFGSVGERIDETTGEVISDAPVQSVAPPVPPETPTPSAPPALSAPLDDQLKARRTSALKALHRTRQKAVDSGVNVNLFASRCNEVVTGLSADDSASAFCLDVLTDETLKKLSAMFDPRTRCLEPLCAK